MTSVVCGEGTLSPYSYLQYPILDKFSRLAASAFVIPIFSLAIKSKYYVATVFDVKQSKVDSYVRSGRLIKIDEKMNI